MTEKPRTAGEYSSEQVKFVRATCLYVATVLGDLMQELVIIGGLVPSLLIDQENLAEEVPPHVGTMDLDVGLAVTLFDESRYQALSDRLRQAGFSNDVNQSGNPTFQRWKIERPLRVTVDFLIPPTHPSDKNGRLRNLESDFAAIITPGLQLAFEDRQQVTLSGHTILGEQASREIWVCGPGAFVVLKALAFDGCGAHKDAYDLYYVVRNYGQSVEDVASRLRRLGNGPDVTRALSILRRDFDSENATGPRRVAEFSTGGLDDFLQADVVGFVGDLLRRLSTP